jgi:hypothetical protein
MSMRVKIWDPDNDEEPSVPNRTIDDDSLRTIRDLIEEYAEYQFNGDPFDEKEIHVRREDGRLLKFEVDVEHAVEFSVHEKIDSGKGGGE